MTEENVRNREFKTVKVQPVPPTTGETKQSLTTVIRPLRAFIRCEVLHHKMAKLEELLGRSEGMSG